MDIEPASGHVRFRRIVALATVGAVLGSAVAWAVLAAASPGEPARLYTEAPIDGLVAATTSPRSTGGLPEVTAPSTTVAPPTIAVPTTTYAAPRPRPAIAGVADWIAQQVEPGETYRRFFPGGDNRGLLVVTSASMPVCGRAHAYSIDRDRPRQLIAANAMLVPREDGRWFAFGVGAEPNCASAEYVVYDLRRDHVATVPAHGYFSFWLLGEARFVTSDGDQFWIYDAPSATMQRIWVSRDLIDRLNAFAPDGGNQAWRFARVAELRDGLAGHIQCIAASCAQDTKAVGWYYVTDGVVDPRRPVPANDRPNEFYCSA